MRVPPTGEVLLLLHASDQPGEDLPPMTDDHQREVPMHFGALV